jgi:hypothetical protein
LDDRKRVRVYAVLSGLALAGAVGLRLGPSAYAARVHVRWREDISVFDRVRLEREFKLREREQREGNTWAYDLSDPSRETVRALVAHPAVADTHYIDREDGVPWWNAPRGTTLIHRNPVLRWRDSPVVEWVGFFSLSSVVASSAWLALNRRARSATR